MSIAPIVWLDRAKKQAVCQCGRPGCPVIFTSAYGRTRADEACNQYFENERKRKYWLEVAKPIYVEKQGAAKVRKESDRAKLDGDHFCLTCGTYTADKGPHDDSCAVCGRGRIVIL